MASISLKTRFIPGGAWLTIIPLVLLIIWAVFTTPPCPDSNVREPSGTPNIISCLRVARHMLACSGVACLPEAMEWQAVNQYTQTVCQVSLPKLQVGCVGWGRPGQGAIQGCSQFTANTARLVGGHCTIFQRMNPQGDMLRIATTVKAADPTLAIGTYLPAFGPDGRANPIVASVLKGSPYLDRPLQKQECAGAAYEPLRDATGTIIGMICVAVD